MKLKALTTTNKLKINNETKIHTHTHTSLPFGKLTLSIHFHFQLLKLENSHNFKSFTAEPMVYIFSMFVVVRAFSFIISTFGNYLLVFLVA